MVLVSNLFTLVYPSFSPPSSCFSLFLYCNTLTLQSVPVSLGAMVLPRLTIARLTFVRIPTSRIICLWDTYPRDCCPRVISISSLSLPPIYKFFYTLSIPLILFPLLLPYFYVFLSPCSPFLTLFISFSLCTSCSPPPPPSLTITFFTPSMDNL